MRLQHPPKMAQEEEGGGEGAPLWIISFADMISLLMAFFVMLSTFSAYDKDGKHKFDAVIHNALLPFGGAFKTAPKNSLSMNCPTSGEIRQGSERPSSGKDLQSRAVQKTSSQDYLRYKVFLIPASSMFYARGDALTIEGRRWLDTLTHYLERVPGKVLVSEQGPETAEESHLRRTIVVAKYLADKGMASDRLNVSSRGTMPESYFQQKEMLEVCLLKQEICP